MGHTNSTPNIGLPQFIGTDKPTWLGDVNGAMSTIDTKVGSIDAAIATTDAKADNAVADASGAVTTATNAVNTAGAASTTATQANNLATQALTVANNTADLCSNRIVPDVAANKSAIGTLADLATTAKDNLVNAINEVAQGGGGGSVTTYACNGTAGSSDATQSNITYGGTTYTDFSSEKTIPGVLKISQTGNSLVITPEHNGLFFGLTGQFTPENYALSAGVATTITLTSAYQNDFSVFLFS